MVSLLATERRLSPVDGAAVVSAIVPMKLPELAGVSLNVTVSPDPSVVDTIVTGCVPAPTIEKSTTWIWAESLHR